jgi:hypothetical protein
MTANQPRDQQQLADWVANSPDWNVGDLGYLTGISSQSSIGYVLAEVLEVHELWIRTRVFGTPDGVWNDDGSVVQDYQVWTPIQKTRVN